MVAEMAGEEMISVKVEVATVATMVSLTRAAG